jgi:hypothetical protein
LIKVERERKASGCFVADPVDRPESRKEVTAEREGMQRLDRTVDIGSAHDDICNPGFIGLSPSPPIGSFLRK